MHVLLHGRVAGVLPKRDATPEELVRWITGVAVESGHDIPEEVAEAELHPERVSAAVIRIAELLDPNVPADLWPLLKQVGVDEVVSLLDDAEQAFRWLRSESHLDERPESVSLPGRRGAAGAALRSSG